jgi:hypothetical protein
MRSPAFIALGLGFVLMGGGLYALTLIKIKDVGPHPTKAQLRERVALAAETRKMRLAAGVIAGLGALLCSMAFF